MDFETAVFSIISQDKEIEGIQQSKLSASRGASLRIIKKINRGRDECIDAMCEDEELPEKSWSYNF